MISLSFTFSPVLKTSVSRIDTFRSEILLAPITPSKRLELQWKATEGYVTNWPHLLLPPRPAREKLKAALDHIKQTWEGSSAAVTPETVAWFDGLLGTHAAEKPDTAKLLEYLNSGSSHPILTAAIAHLAFAPSPIAFLLPLVFIYRKGYDAGGMVCIDGFWRLNHESYTSLLISNQTTAAITAWMEFYAQAAVYQYGLTHREVLHPTREVSQGIWLLTDRQKAILVLLESPGASVTNRQVQKHFKISQVTASRDLAKLAQLSLVYPHGHGRSIYYTWV